MEHWLTLTFLLHFIFKYHDDKYPRYSQKKFPICTINFDKEKYKRHDAKVWRESKVRLSTYEVRKRFDVYYFDFRDAVDFRENFDEVYDTQIAPLFDRIKK